MKKQLRPETVETDGETGLTYHWNRWRNEEGDAFISEDPIRDGYNWYGYALGNPFKYADGTGLATYVCRDGTFCNEGDISNPSYRADCYHYNGYNAGTIASMSGPAYNLANNGGQATLSLAGTRADPGRNKSSPSAAEEIKNCGNVDVENVTRGKISDTEVLLENKDELDDRITELVVYLPVIYVDPNGMWIDRDPRTLQVGETVGKSNTPTYYFNQNNNSQYYDNNGNLVLVGTALPNTWETVGDALSAASFFLNCANLGCTFTGQFAAAEGCGTVAAGCDLGATFCYFAGGCNDKAVASLIGFGLDLVPTAAYYCKPTLKAGYNAAAHRFINPSTGRFITNTAGYANYISGPAVGITYTIGSTIYSNNKE